ncbi:MmgE/PrpD family protein [Paenarthrobacter ureafaciens]|nr:MmgE/PrpD family protein [Paenarthrobacter ureafaciens]
MQFDKGIGTVLIDTTERRDADSTASASAQPGSPITQQLAAFLTDPDLSFPEAVATKVKLHILDTLGCQVAFASLPWSREVQRYAVTDRPEGPANLAYYGTPVPVEIAAFANAGFGHGFEMDDTEMRTASHPGVVVVPAALATGQARAASGSDFLKAVTVGYEVMIRVGLGSVGMMRRGFHTTAVTGVFGATAASASVMRVSADQAAHGLGIAASKASGITEYSASGGSVKRIHAGFAAQAGVESMAMAGFGVTAPTAALEGPRGLLAAVSDTVDTEVVTRGLGVDYELLTTGLKPYCCCAGQHAVIDAVIELLATAPGVDPSAVRRIRVLQNSREVDVVGRIVEPKDLTAAQFSAAFGIGLRLVKGGNGFGDYLGASLDDEQILEVARKVVYERTPANSPLPGHGPARVTFEMHDGSEMVATVSHARGSTARPLDEEEVVRKFRSLAEGPLGERSAAQVQDMVLNLEKVPDVNALAALLQARKDHEPLDSRTI